MESSAPGDKYHMPSHTFPNTTHDVIGLLNNSEVLKLYMCKDRLGSPEVQIYSCICY